MTSGVRFAAANARMHALKAGLWTARDRPLLVRTAMTPDGRAVSGAPADVYPPLARWYATFAAIYPSARTLVLALFRRHEIENLKLLWRAAVRGRAPMASCWRPLEPLATIPFSPRAVTPADLARSLQPTPYGTVARAMLRGHAADLPAVEIGLDRWVFIALAAEAARLQHREPAAAQLLRALMLEHDVELLARGVSLGLAGDLVAKSTIVLSRERDAASLPRAAAWTAADGPLSRVLPRPLASLAPGAAGWDDVTMALRTRRRRACFRAFVGWPFGLAPAIAALVLREEQARAETSLAAARSAPRASGADVNLALAAGAMEA